MEVLVNNQPVQTSVSCTLDKLLPLLGISDTRGLAIAVNDEVIARTNWISYQLSPKDKVILIKATQGG